MSAEQLRAEIAKIYQELTDLVRLRQLAVGKLGQLESDAKSQSCSSEVELNKSELLAEIESYKLRESALIISRDAIRSQLNAIIHLEQQNRQPEQSKGMRLSL